MSISSKQYAIIANFILEESKDREIGKKSIGKLAKLIIENQDQGKIERIASEFERILKKKEGVVEVRALSAKKLSTKQEESLRKAIGKRMGIAEKLIVIHSEVDETLIGGISIQIGDEVIDGSLRTKFEKLENSLS